MSASTSRAKMGSAVNEVVEERKCCGLWCKRICGSLCFLFIAFMILASSTMHRDRLHEMMPDTMKNWQKSDSMRGSSSRSNAKNNADISATAESQPKVYTSKCDKWQKLRAVACVWEDVIDLAYMMPYWAEHLGLDYELFFLDVATAAQKKQAESERELGCALHIVVIPRGGHVNAQCTQQNKKVYDDAKSLRLLSKKDQGNIEIKSKFTDKKWHDEVAVAKDWQPVALTNNRPFIVKTKGEVFWPRTPEPNIDLVLFRALDAVGQTATAHFLQGVTLWYRNGEPENGSPSAAALVQSGEQLTKEYFQKIMNEKKGFATIINSAVVKRHFHQIDASLRFVVATILNEKKPVHGLGHAAYLQNHSLVKNCNGRDLASFKCMEPYKFSISMENSRYPGYVSEKIVNAKLANTVPVYFGASNVDDYFNPEAFVFCNVSAAAIAEIRSFDDQAGKYPQVLADLKEKAKNQNNEASDEQLVQFVRNHVGKELEPCVNEVMRLDGDDVAYLKMLSAPMYRDNKYHKTITDGYVVGRGVADLIRDLKE